jgi:hypothetical protein
MRPRTFIVPAVALLIGIVIGGLLVGSSADLRNTLFGSAGITAPAAPAYFLVDTESAQSWLAATYPEEADAIVSAFENAAALVTTADFAATVREVQPDIDRIVRDSFAALTGIDPGVNALATPFPTLDPALLPEPLLRSTVDGPVSSCLGLDENPYNLDGFALYLYLQVPSTQTQFLPETWEALDEPLDDDLFWQRLGCLSTAQGEVARSR